MFEDATFESMGTIHTRSRNWMLATFGLNGSIIAILIAIPLIYPSVLPKMMSAITLETPPPMEETHPVAQQAPAEQHQSDMSNGRVQAPPTIPTHTYIPTAPEPVWTSNAGDLAGPASGPGSPDNLFNGHHVQTVVQQAPQTVRRISGGVMEGMLINRVLPVYPTPAREMHIAGRVELQATISRQGTIENLRVVNGPALLRGAAIEAVQQ